MRKVHANQIIWKTKNVVVPKEQYCVINQTVSSVTFNDTSALVSPLTCNILVDGELEQNIYGIHIHLGFPPDKPENLSCIVIQTQKRRFVQTCTWEPGRDTFLNTNYTLKSRWPNKTFPDCIPKGTNNSCTSSSEAIFFVNLYVWVEAKNDLGEAESDHIEFDPVKYVKPLPPHNLSLNSGEFSTVLKLSWEDQFNEPPLHLKYKIRYRTIDSTSWTEVPPEDTASERTSFTIQELQPFTKYSFQLCCAVKYWSDYWSEWSEEVVGFTAEDRTSEDHTGLQANQFDPGESGTDEDRVSLQANRFDPGESGTDEEPRRAPSHLESQGPTRIKAGLQTNHFYPGDSGTDKH
ncbi:hypothetical protein JD844_008548 [Phrynosoma platyrhinos]|uniref:Fibronectin type-III domain-containing protein n=1 Tax=Phrynosoma platyrhinos TaxID=52577 RepID=A0ABQ7TEN1_PHRPL|nr:hypothetical protein JD844_008548 [Phrynosoma platyrhinos]